MLVNYPILKNTFNIKPISLEKNACFAQRYRDFNVYPRKSRSSMHATFLSNSGIVNAYEVVNVKKGNVKIVGESGYRGEAYLLNNNGYSRVVQFTPNQVIIEVDLSKPDRLILNQNFDSGWRVRGVKSRVNPYNGLISAEIPQGQHRVVFYYLPLSFMIGSVITVFSILFLCIFLLRKDRNKERIRAR